MKSEVCSVGPVILVLTNEVILEGRLDIPVKRHGKEDGKNGEHDHYRGLKDNGRNTTAAG